LSYSTSVHGEVKEWVGANIARRKVKKPDWIIIEMIPDDVLPRDVLEAEGGAMRRRSSYRLREIVGLVTSSRGELVPLVSNETSRTKRQTEAWKSVAEAVYDTRSKNFKRICTHVRRIRKENEELMKPLLERCPAFELILAHILMNKLGFRAQEVSWTSETTDWGEEACKRVGRSLALFLRKRKTGEVALGAWRGHYPQLEALFELQGFEDFMVTIANNTLRDSIYGTMYRVSVGAVLSMIDVATDIYVISTYYQSEALKGRANVLIAMISINTIIKLLVVFGNYQKKDLTVKVKEALITLFFLRPAVDAYRVSTNQEDEENSINRLTEVSKRSEKPVYLRTPRRGESYSYLK